MSAQPRTFCNLRPKTNYDRLVRSGKLLPLHSYDKIIISFSGGKDSIALVLQQLEWAVVEMQYPIEQIELWHQHIDGDPTEDHDNFMDWACTPGYVKAVAKALGITLKNQWKDGGFEGELLRDNISTGGVYYEDGFGATIYAPPQKPVMKCKRKTYWHYGLGYKREYVICEGHTYDKPTWDESLRRWTVKGADQISCPLCGKNRRGIGSRMRWPAKGADLQTRWCSGYLKIDVAKRAINGDSRFDGENILVLTGERREESKARSKYDEVVPHGSNTKSRRVDQWRSILDWNETWVWAIMERWRIYPHPAYVLGWDRVSCALCIFAGPNQYASAQQIIPLQFNGVSNMETRLGHTVNHERKKGEVNALPVLELASRGTSFIDAPQWVIDLALSKDYPMDRVFVPEDEMWELPQGAFKKTGCGPT